MSVGYMRQCAGKDRHESKAAARLAKASLAARKSIRPDRLTVYTCDQCLGAHIGGTRGSFKTRTRTGKRPNKRLRGRQ